MSFTLDEKLKAEALRDLCKKKAVESSAKAIIVVMYGDQMTWVHTGMGPGETLDRLVDIFGHINKKISLDRGDTPT
jgi:hypothetical protein